jgi:hypothetical protein
MALLRYYVSAYYCVKGDLECDNPAMWDPVLYLLRLY